jgi:hypothetical protein
MTLFRESDKPDGKPGPVSMRRVLAFLSFLVSPVAFFFCYIGKENVSVASSIPGIALLVFATVMLLFTTWADVQAIIGAWRGGK